MMVVALVTYFMVSLEVDHELSPALIRVRVIRKSQIRYR